MKNILIKNRAFSQFNPYIISEIGVNHGGDLDLAKKMIENAAKAGSHGVKFQTYKAEKIASKEHSKSYWDLNEESSTSQYELFKKYDAFGEKEYRELAEHAEKCGADFLSTPFDLEAVDMLDPLVPFFKIASADITNIPLLRKIASKGKPIILSTGASQLFEIQNALDVLRIAGSNDITLLHCILNYPTPEDNAQLSEILKLKKVFGEECAIGYSDHVKPNEDGSLPALLMACHLGAVVLEKHYTHDKSLPGNDHYHAMNAIDLEKFCKELGQYRNLFGDGSRDLKLENSARVNARRRICFAGDLEIGSKVKEIDLIALRADQGIPIEHFDSIVNKELKVKGLKNAPVNWEDFK